MGLKAGPSVRAPSKNANGSRGGLTEETASGIGERIYSVRLRLDRSVPGFAAMLGVSADVVAGWEAGRGVDREALTLIAASTDTAMEWLIAGLSPEQVAAFHARGAQPGSRRPGSGGARAPTEERPRRCISGAVADRAADLEMLPTGTRPHSRAYPRGVFSISTRSRGAAICRRALGRIDCSPSAPSKWAARRVVRPNDGRRAAKIAKLPGTRFAYPRRRRLLEDGADDRRMISAAPRRFLRATPVTAGFDPRRAPAWPAPTATPIYLDRDGRTARVDVQLGSITKRMVIDTVATGLSIPAWIAERLLWRREAVEAQSAIMTLANGREELRQGVKLWSVSVGGRTLLDVYATVAPHEAEPLLGFPVLNQGADFHHRHRRRPSDHGLTATAAGPTASTSAPAGATRSSARRDNPPACRRTAPRRRG